MKRSGGVTAASVVLVVVGALVTLTSFSAVFGEILLHFVDPKTSGLAFPRMVATSTLSLAIAIWGIITGVGLLRLRRWAWFCMLAISVLLVVDATPGILHAHKLISATTGVPTEGAAGLIVFEYISLVVLTLIPLALGIWWLVLFTRHSVRAQFAPGVQRTAPELSVVYAQPAFADGMSIASPRNQLSYRRPVSITVIAVWFFAGAAAFPVFLLYPSRWRVAAMFGTVLAGNAVLGSFAVMSVVSLLLGVGLIRLKPWARIASIAYLALLIVNSAVSTGAQARAFQMMMTAMGAPKFPANEAEIFQRIMHFSMIFGVVFGACLTLVAIYFLATRGGAFQRPPGQSSPTLEVASPSGGAQ